MNTHGDTLGDTALDILVYIGHNQPARITQTAEHVCVSYHAVLYHLGHALRDRVLKIRVARRLVRLEVNCGE